MKATTKEKRIVNPTEKAFYAQLMKKAKGEFAEAYAQRFGYAKTTFNFRLVNMPFSVAEKKFFEDYAALNGLEYEAFKAQFKEEQTQA